jgi:hypothetical protein
MAALPDRCRTTPKRREWTVEECAVYAARRQFELIKLLSSERRLITTYNRMNRPFGWGPPKGGGTSNAPPNGGVQDSPRGEEGRRTARRERRGSCAPEARRAARRKGTERRPNQGGGDEACSASSSTLESDGVVVNAKERRRRLRAAARESARTHRLIITVCLVVTFVARLRSRVGTARCLARQRTHMLGEGGGSVEGIEALARVSPKRSYSELSPGYGQNLLSLSSPIACELASHAMAPHANLQLSSQSPTERPAKARLVVLRV